MFCAYDKKARNLPAHTNCNPRCSICVVIAPTRNLPAHTNCNVPVPLYKSLYSLLETYLRIRIATTFRAKQQQGFFSKLTCAYELQLQTVRRFLHCWFARNLPAHTNCNRARKPTRTAAKLETYLRIRIATTYTAHYSMDNQLETYLRIRIATQIRFYIRIFLRTRNLPAHTNCNPLTIKADNCINTRNLPAHTNCNRSEQTAPKNQ